MAMTLLAANGSEAIADTVQTLPQLKLTVIDTQSGKPIEGITVHYLAMRKTSWTAFPMTLEAHISSTIADTATAQTDANGIVIFKNIKVELESFWLIPKEQRVESELLFINLAPLSDPPKFMLHKSTYEYLWSTIPFLRDLDRPNKNYLGYLIETADIPVAHERDENIATVRFEPNMAQGAEERSFVARLKPAANDVRLK